MNKPVYYFIVNPSSRSGKGTVIWEEIEETLRENHVAYEGWMLKGPGDAFTAARELSRVPRPCIFVVVGGDGTLNEFISGLTSFEGITMGFIPSGSANDFARATHLPSDPYTCLDIILSGRKIRNMNIGTITAGKDHSRFIVSSGIGFDAAVCHEVARSSSKAFLNRIHLGYMSYTVNALKLLFSMKRTDMRILLDDQQLLSFDSVLFAAAMNVKYEGGGFMFAPKASPVDDKLDLIVAEGISKLKTLLMLPTAFKGKHVGFKGIHIYRCRKAIIQCSEEQCVHTDGEVFGKRKKITLSLMEEKLPFIIG